MWQHAHLFAIVTLVVRHEFTGPHVFFGPAIKRSQTCRVWQHAHLFAIVTLVVRHEFTGPHVFFVPPSKLQICLGVAACAPDHTCNMCDRPRIYRPARIFRGK